MIFRKNPFYFLEIISKSYFKLGAKGSNILADPNAKTCFLI